jgi:hypothetical protein
MGTLCERVAASKTPFGVSRKSADQWAAIVDRESRATGEPVLVVLRAHHDALDQKISVVAGFTGFMGAAIALFVPTISIDKSHPLLLAVFGLLIGATAYAAFFSLNALTAAAGGDHGAEDLEVNRVMRLARRALNYAGALAFARAGAIIFAVFMGMSVGVNIDL